MKTMTCKQLGGSCDKQFRAETFEQMAELSRTHGVEMYKAGDIPHIEAMKKMQDIMKSPSGIKEWIENKIKEFEALPDD